MFEKCEQYVLMLEHEISSINVQWNIAIILKFKLKLQLYYLL